MDRRPARRRHALVSRRTEPGRRRRHDIDAYYRAEQDPDVYRADPLPDAPLDAPRQLA